MSNQSQSGTTLIELIAVIGIFSILVSFATINLLSFRDKTTLAASLDTLVTDIKSQQIKAMVGDTQGATAAPYGIYFERSSYTLFRGSSFVPGLSSNFTINLEGGVELTDIAFSGGTLVFERGNGEVLGWVSGQNTLNVRSTFGQEGEKNLTINRLGAIDIE